MRNPQAKLAEWRRLRWFVLVVVVAGIGTSVTLNVEHAPHNWGAKLVAAIPPVAVFGIIEMVSRIPSSSMLLSTGRILASLGVSGVGGAISYVQQVAYVRGLGFGQDPGSGWIATVFPIVIDGTMVVATLSLVEVVRKIRDAKEALDALPTTAVARRAAQDQLEAPETLAYRRSADEHRRSGELVVSARNGEPVLPRIHVTQSAS